MKYRLEKSSEFVYELPPTGPMQVPLRLYTTEGMLTQLLEDQSGVETKSNLYLCPSSRAPRNEAGGSQARSP